MAGVSTKEIKNRIRSMEATRQITKAMEMVASSKLRRAQTQVQASKPYFEALSATIRDIVESNREFSSPYMEKRKGEKVLHIVIAGDRGLAGGYNSNVLKKARAQMEEKDFTVLPIGRKAGEYCKSHKIPCLWDSYHEAANMSIGDCFTAAKYLCKEFLKGTFDEIYISYTVFHSVLSQTPETIQILPLSRQKTDREGASGDVMYEPDSETVFQQIIPEYVGGILYGALCESRVSEQAARRTAMDSATQNADEMIDQLSLEFNRARQAAITQEITEIVAGS